MAQCVVIGANGLVGGQVTKILNANNIPWIGTYNHRAQAGLIQLDVTNKKQVREIIMDTKPDVVFQCANLAGGVDFCENNPNMAKAFHLDAVITMGKVIHEINAYFTFISTDYVFDGTSPPYKESDQPNPLNYYGQMKLAAEQWILDNLPRSVIVRTTNVYGWDPQTVTPNYVMSMYRTLSAGNEFFAPVFLKGNPTYAADLAAALVELYEKGASGVYHVVGTSYVNRVEWAKLACKAFGLDVNLIKEKNHMSQDMVPRPLNSYLHTGKFMASYKTPLHSLEQGLELMRNEIIT